MAIKPSLIFALSLVLFGMGISVTALDEDSKSKAEDSKSGGKHVFHKAGSTEMYRRGPMLSEFMLTAEQTEGRYSIVREIFKPGMSSYPGHSHHFHSEVFFIVSGVMEWTVNGETKKIGPGDLVYIPPNSPHAGRVVGDEDVHALMIYEPAGYERNYFRRRALSEEERRDPEVRRKLMYEADVHMKR